MVEVIEILLVIAAFSASAITYIGIHKSNKNVEKTNLFMKESNELMKLEVEFKWRPWLFFRNFDTQYIIIDENLKVTPDEFQKIYHERIKTKQKLFIKEVVFGVEIENSGSIPAKNVNVSVSEDTKTIQGEFKIVGSNITLVPGGTYPVKIVIGNTKELLKQREEYKRYRIVCEYPVTVKGKKTMQKIGRTDRVYFLGWKSIDEWTDEETLN